MRIRLTMNPGRSAETMTCLPSRAGERRGSRLGRVASSSPSPRMSSMSGMTGTGLKKCIADEARPARFARPPPPAGRSRSSSCSRRRSPPPGRRASSVAPEGRLDVEVLEDRLDDEVGVGDGLEVVGRRRPGRAWRRALGASSWPLATARSRLPAIRSRPASARARSGSYSVDLLADRGVDLGDAVAHQPGARPRRPARSSSCRSPLAPRRARQQPIGGGVRVERVVGDLARASRPSRRRGVPSSSAPPQPVGDDRPDLGLGPRERGPAPSGAVAARAVAVDRAPSSSGTPSPVDAVVIRTSGRFGRGRSSPSARAAAPAAAEHRPELARGPLRPRPVALVHDHDVGDLEQARP